LSSDGFSIYATTHAIAGRSSPSCWQRPSLLFKGKGEAGKAKSPKPEAESGSGVLGDGDGEWAASSLPINYRGSEGSAVSCPSRVRGGAQAAKRFSCILEVPDGVS